MERALRSNVPALYLSIILFTGASGTNRFAMFKRHIYCFTGAGTEALRFCVLFFFSMHLHKLLVTHFIQQIFLPGKPPVSSGPILFAADPDL